MGLSSNRAIESDSLRGGGLPWFCSLAELVPDPAAFFDVDGTLLSLNQSFLHTFGWTSQELASDQADFVPPELGDQARGQLRELARGSSRSVRTRRRNREGRELEVIWHLSPCQGPDGRPAGHVEIYTDLTRELGQRRQLEILLELASTLPGFQDLDGLLFFLGEKIKEFLNAESASVILLDPAEDELFFRHVQPPDSEMEPLFREVRFPASQGLAGHVLATKRPLHISDVRSDPRFYPHVDSRTGFVTRNLVYAPLIVKGRAAGVLGAVNHRWGDFDPQDLQFLQMVAHTVALAVENARVTDELVQEQGRLRAVVQQIPAGLMLAEAPSGRVVLQNRQAEAILGHSSRPGSVREYAELGLADPAGRPLEPREHPLARALGGEELTRPRRYLASLPEGGQRALAVNAAPVRDAGGEVVAAVCIFVDVTEEERNRQELAALNRELERRVVERTAELEAGAVTLEETNTALRVLLENRERAKQDLQQTILANMNRLVLPVVDKLKRADTPQVRQALLSSLESNLQELTSGFAQRLSSGSYGLTARELEVAGYVRDGKSSDEISEILHITVNSVLFHRANIRKKLGLHGKKQRLAAFLRQMG
jgi:PAS domain S-box-containing protein